MEAGQAGFAICVIITVALAHVASASATPTKELGGSRPAVLTRSPQYVRGGHALPPPPTSFFESALYPPLLGPPLPARDLNPLELDLLELDPLELEAVRALPPLLGLTRIHWNLI